MSNKCHFCNKYSLILLNCGCKNQYCTRHVLPEKHKCTNISELCNNLKEKNKIKLENQKTENPVIEKLFM